MGEKMLHEIKKSLEFFRKFNSFTLARTHAGSKASGFSFKRRVKG